ncbi:hypothetical protein, partial [Nocardioides alcanivorans]|uniref:hypothetical protein n=1 Tax=Nocardioides alcanivorans TaxID=2897352 RepID=UPI001F2C6B8B
DAAAEPDAAEPASSAPGILQRPRTTRILAVLVGVAAVVLGILVVLQFQDEPDPGRADVAMWTPVTRAGEFTLPKEGELPVATTPLEWTAAVDEIAHNVTKILSFNYETIDTHEELAAELVTEDFLVNDLRQTIAETAPKLKENEAEYVVTVAGQSVISATPTRVRALLFVNQLVTKGTGKNAVSDNYPLRLDVVGEKDGDTWRISSLQAG